jgi:nicotinamidase/pyrazinamidase
MQRNNRPTRHKRLFVPSRRALLHTMVFGSIALSLPLLPRRAQAARITPDAHSALIVVDVQNCFVTGGTLAVTNGEAVVPVINRIAPAFATVVMTQDWHTPGHVSFASAHPGKKPFDTIELPYGTQVLWPDHCVRGTDDAKLQKDLDVSRAQLIIRKGYRRDMDSYSAFAEADHTTATGLGGYLKQRGVRSVYLAGLATDYCVAWTAIDARKAGFDTYVIEDACRAIDLNGSLATAWKTMSASGVKRIQSGDIAV